MAIIVWFLLLLPMSFAQEMNATLIRSSKPHERITTLEWKTGPQGGVSVFQDGAKIWVKLEGGFAQIDWTLIKGESVLLQSTRDTNTFSVEIPITGQVTNAHLWAISPYGEVRTEKIVIYVPHFAKMKARAVPRSTRPPPPFSVSANLGMTKIAYSETNQPDLSEVALTAKAAAQVSMSPRWDLGMSAFVTALPITNDVPGMSVRFLGVNMRVGYVMSFPKKPWSLMLMGGVYYITMMTSGSFGFEHMAGPQLFPVLKRDFTNQWVSAYFKLSPVTQRLALMSLSNRELALGASWNKRLQRNRSWLIAFDLSDLSVASSGLSAEVSTATLSVGFGW